MTKIKSLFDFQEVFPTEQVCVNYLEEIIWKGKPVSPHDPTSQIYKCKSRKNWYKCKNTNKYFNAKTGTVFENSKLPLQKWFYALYIFSSDKKSTSSYRLTKLIGVTQKTAWFLLHRLRYISDCSIFKTMLKDFVEIDEAFIGGSNLNRHWDKKAPKTQGRNWKDKIPVFGMIERGGNLICQVVPNTKKRTLESIIRKNIKEGSNVSTDEWLAYKDLGKWFNHQIVNHKKKQYVNGEATTNRIENPWSHLKRSIYGIYHQISKKHAQQYVNEFTLKFNAREYSEQDKFDLILASSAGKRLTYKELTNRCFV